MPKVRDVEEWTRNLANTLEANVMLIVVPEGGGLQVAFAGKAHEAFKMPPLLRHIADEMDKKNDLAKKLAASGDSRLGIDAGRIM